MSTGACAQLQSHAQYERQLCVGRAFDHAFHMQPAIQPFSGIAASHFDSLHSNALRPTSTPVRGTNAHPLRLECEWLACCQMFLHGAQPSLYHEMHIWRVVTMLKSPLHAFGATHQAYAITAYAIKHIPPWIAGTMGVVEASWSHCKARSDERKSDRGYGPRCSAVVL